LLLASPRSARANDLPAEARPAADRPARPPLWRAEWPNFRWWEGAGTIAAGVGTLVLFSLEPPTEAIWEGGVLFDEPVRNALRLPGEQARLTIATVGDIPYFAAPILPLIVDPLLVAWAGHGDGRAALNMELMGLEAFSYAGFLSFVSTRISRRERPDSRQCREDHPDGASCEPTDTEAFWSGHTSIAATSAGLVCANHTRMPLWGHPLADASACALASGGAALTAVTRLMADRHYATDVIVGFGVGWGIGYAVPVLLHYSNTGRNLALSIQPGKCTGGCLTLRGAF
jgi:membrane-associated phospholipid phosphatase